MTNGNFFVRILLNLYIKRGIYMNEKNFIQRMLLEQSKLEEYYRDLRKYELETHVPIKNRENFEKNIKKEKV